MIRLIIRMPTTNEIQENQPIITINSYGSVANGKSTLIKILSGINPMKYKKEIVKNMTIKLGYINIKIYKCTKCECPKCYQINNNICENCKEINILILHMSIIDAPGHNDLQTTALKTIDLVDLCLLLFSSETSENITINDHYNSLKYYDLLENTFILHNKIDLISKDLAIEQYQNIKKNFNVKTVIPISAQYGYGIDYLVQLISEKIKIPTNEEFTNICNLPLKATIIRSFDVNNQNINIDEVLGGVVGIHIKHGTIKLGDTIEIIPGLIMKDGNAKKITAVVNSIKTDETELEIAYPGGLFGIGLTIDPSLTKNNKLEGNYMTNINNTHFLNYNEATIELNNKNHFKAGESVPFYSWE